MQPALYTAVGSFSGTLRRQASVSQRLLSSPRILQCYFISHQSKHKLGQCIKNYLYSGEAQESTCLTSLQVTLIQVFDSNSWIILEKKVSIHSHIFLLLGRNCKLYFNLFTIITLLHFLQIQGWHSNLLYSDWLLGSLLESQPLGNH